MVDLNTETFKFGCGHTGHACCATCCDLLTKERAECPERKLLAELVRKIVGGAPPLELDFTIAAALKLFKD